MSDPAGNLGTWRVVNSDVTLSMTFIGFGYRGTWDQGNGEFSGTFAGPYSGTWAMVVGAGNSAACVPPDPPT